MVQVKQTRVTKQAPGLPPVPFTGFRDTATAQTSKKDVQDVAGKGSLNAQFPKNSAKAKPSSLEASPLQHGAQPSPKGPAPGAECAAALSQLSAGLTPKLKK